MDSPAVKATTPTSTAGSKPAREIGGFTLVELLVVLVIISLMLALVGTSISRNVTGAEMRTAAHKVAANLRYTRTQAILQKSEQVFLVDTENRSFQAPGRRLEELPEGIAIQGGTPRGAVIETYNDHRIAMSFAILGLVAPGMRITGEACVAKSFPGFWQALEDLY